MCGVGVTDLADAEAVPLADVGMAFPAEIGDIGSIGVTPLAETGMVNMGVTDGMDAAPMEDKDVDFYCDNPKSTKYWCRRETGVIWKMTKAIVTPSGQMWGKDLSLPGVHRG